MVVKKSMLLECSIASILNGRETEKTRLNDECAGVQRDRRIEANFANSESAKKGPCTGLKKGCRDGIWRDMAWVAGAVPCPIMCGQFAWSGHATDVVRARLMHGPRRGQATQRIRQRDGYSKRCQCTRSH